MAQDDINNQGVIVTGIAGAVLVFVVIVASQAFYYHMESAELERKVVKAVPEKLHQLENEQIGQLNGYRWVDRQKQIVAIPIEEAMKRVAQDLSQDAERSGGASK